MVTCGSSDRGLWGVDAVTMDRLGSGPPLLGPPGCPGLNDCVHVLHQLQLLPPEVLLLDELLPGLVLLFSDSLLLRFQSEHMKGWKESHGCDKYHWAFGR